MYPFVETIRIIQGKACNLPYHNARLNATLCHLRTKGESACIRIEDFLAPPSSSQVLKCRILYDKTGILEVSYTPYTVRPIHSLRLVYSDEIDYSYKSTDRSSLNRLFSLRDEADDVLIVKQGILTDTSIANIALSDGTDWYTPQTPLLKGTCRAMLLDKGIIKEKEIAADELPSFSRIRLFNAMIEWGVLELPVSQIITR